VPSKNFPLDGPISLLARLGYGSITVDAQDGLTEAVVSVEPRVAGSDIVDRIAVERRGSVLAIVAPRQGGIFDVLGGRRDKDAVDVHVTVPSGTTLKISSFTASVTTHGHSGTTDIAFGSANADLDVVDGDLRLRYGSGTASVDEVTGSVQMRSGGGDARFGRIGGSLDSGRGSGRLEVGFVQGRVRTRSGSGSAVLSSVHDDIDLACGSGTVEIGLPAGRSARLDVTTGSGRVRSDLPIENQPASKVDPITVRARTGSGDVRLFRASA
jgi:hypothetical protein